MYPSIKLDWLYPGADISLYFLAIGVGFFFAAWLTSRQYQRLGYDRSETQDFFIWMLIIGVIGARLMHVLADGFLMDYVYLCIDPMQLDGKALRSLEPCISNAQCFAAQEAGEDIGAIETSERLSAHLRSKVCIRSVTEYDIVAASTAARRTREQVLARWEEPIERIAQGCETKPAPRSLPGFPEPEGVVEDPLAVIERKRQERRERMKKRASQSRNAPQTA